MKYLKFFENSEVPDLREMTPYVKCIKSLHTKFHKDSVYKVSGARGDPQRSIEKYGINDYVPLACISVAKINNILFKVSEKYKSGEGLLDFYEYFELMDESYDTEKYNL